MNSPRKYSSPYLTTIPGLTPSANRLKKRSRTSIVKVNESNTQVQTDNKTNGSGNPSQDQVAFDDASCGDVDQTILQDLKAATNSINASQEAAKQEHEDKNSKTEGATAIASTSNESFTQNDSEGNYTGHENNESTRGDSSRCTMALKSILKKPTPYKDKSARRLDFTNNNDITKKTAKSPKSKNGRTPKEAKESLIQVRPLVKQKIGAIPISPSRINAQQQRGAGAQPSKSPRRKAKALQAKVEEKQEVLPAPKKAVRFSHRVDVYAVPYESRAGTRACDWQRNMLEQRMQAFRQLMKDVNTDELDFMGNGMLFPGFSFPAPNQNSIAVRGRGVRNFSNFKL